MGRPADSSITISFLSDQRMDVFWEYGMNPGSYALATATFVAATDTALEADVTGLTPDTRYYYRTRYRLNGTTTAFQAGPEHPYSVCYFDRHSWELQPGQASILSNRIFRTWLPVYIF